MTQLSPDLPVDVRVASQEDRHALQRMYTEQMRILHHFNPEVRLDQELEDKWWEAPKDLFPYAFFVDGNPVGFCLVMASRYVAAVGQEGDFLIWEMYVEAPYRGRGVAEEGLRAILMRKPGRWSVQAMPKNERAMGFWRRVTLNPPFNGKESLQADGFASFQFLAP